MQNTPLLFTHFKYRNKARVELTKKKKREIIWSSKSERLDYEYLNKTNNIHMTSIGGIYSWRTRFDENRILRAYWAGTQGFRMFTYC